MATYKDKISVLRTYELGESDKIAICLSEEHGKISLIVKGARKTGSRFAGSMQPFTSGFAMIYLGKSLDILSQFEISEAFLPIKTDLLRQSAGMVMSEAIEISIEKSYPSFGIFRLYEAALGNLCRSSFISLSLYSFLLQLLAETGYRPELKHCTVCGSGNGLEVAKPLYSPRSGGIVCRSCANQVNDCLIIDQAAVLQLESLLGYGWAESETSFEGFMVSKKVAYIIEEMSNFHWERKMKSIGFLKKVFG